MARIEVILDGKDHTEKAFATFRKRLKGTIGELKTSRKDVTMFSTDVKAASQSVAKSAPEYIKMQKHLRAYDKSLTRLTGQIPKTTAQQNSWKAAMTRSVNAMKPYIKNFGEVSPLYGKVAKDAIKFNNNLIQSTGFIKKGGKYVETFSGKMKRLANSFADCSGPLYKWGRIFNHYLPIVFVGLYAFKNLQKQVEELTKSFTDFESELITIERTTGMAHSTITRLGDTFLALSAITPATIADFEKIAVTAGRLGIEGEANVLKFTEAVIKMANATILTADQASDSLARVSKAMGLPIDNVLYLGSMIDTLANTSAANAEQIVTVMKRAAGAAKVMDIPAEALAAMGATLVESGEESARAGTRLGRAFVYAATHIATMARQMGVSVEELRERMEEDMLEVWKDYLKMLKDTPSKIDRISKAHEVFGMIGTKAVTKLANNYEKFLEHLEDAHQDMLYGITLEREYAKTLETTAAKLQMVDNEIEALRIRLGEKLAPVTLAMKGITKDFYEILAGPEPIEYGHQIGYITEEVKELLTGNLKLIDASDGYNSMLNDTIYNFMSIERYESAYLETINAERRAFEHLLPPLLKYNDARVKDIKDIRLGIDVRKDSFAYWLKEADLISKGAMSQIVFADAINKGMTALAKYGMTARRTNAMTMSLTKTMIEEGIASKILEETWEELGKEIENNRKLVSDMTKAQIKWGDITEWLANIQMELDDAMANHLKIVNDSIGATGGLADAYYEVSDALAYLNGEYPTFRSLTKGAFADIEGIIVPLELFEMGIRNLGEAIPEKYMKPVRKLQKLNKDVIVAFQEVNTIKRDSNATDKERVIAMNKANKAVEVYTTYLGEVSPIISELDEKSREWGISESKRYKQMIDAAIIEAEELKIMKESPTAIENLISSKERLANIEAEIEEITKSRRITEEQMQKSQKEGISIWNAAIMAIETVGKVGEKERATHLNRIYDIIGEGNSLEETNKKIIDYVELQKRTITSQDKLGDSSERLNDLGEEFRSILYKDVKLMVDYDYITGKTADDMKLLISASAGLNNITEEERKSIAALAVSTLYMGTQMGNVESQVEDLNRSLSGFGLTATYIPDILKTEMDESGMIIEDMMGNVLINTQDIGGGVRDILGGLSEEAKVGMGKVGLEWEGIFGKAAIATIAFTAPMQTVLGYQLIKLGEIALDTSKLKYYAEKEAGVPELPSVIKTEGMQFGGMVEKTSLYKLHKGEEVIPKGEVSKGGTMSISIGNVNLSPDYPAQRFLEDLEKYRFSIT